jgi:hypothetical protein
MLDVKEQHDDVLDELQRIGEDVFEWIYFYKILRLWSNVDFM